MKYSLMEKKNNIVLLNLDERYVFDEDIEQQRQSEYERSELIEMFQQIYLSKF